MTDERPDAAAGAAVRNELVNPSSASAALIEYALFGLHGLTDLRERLVAEANAVSAAADKRTVRLVKERFGMRSPMLRGGWHSLLVFLLTFSPLLPLRFLNVLRFGQDGTESVAAAFAAVVGGLLVVVALLPGARPVARSALIQSQVTAALMLVVTGIGIAAAGGGSMLLAAQFVAGGAGAVIAVVIYLVVRHRDPQATAAIDNALDTAFLDVGAEVATERARLLDELERGLSERGADVDALRAERAAAFVAVRADGNTVADDHPDSLPGTYLVTGHTNGWLPPSRRGDWDA